MYGQISLKVAELERGEDQPKQGFPSPLTFPWKQNHDWTIVCKST